MILFGSIINVVCIVIGSLIGVFFSNFDDKYKQTIMQGISLTVILIGLQMAIKSDSIIILLLSIVLGAFVGELLNLDNRLNEFGNWVATKFRNQDETINIGQAFVTASLLFGVGAMSIIGSLDSGLRMDHEILITKSILDGFTSFVLSTTLGIGVILSAIPVFLFQGTITLLSKQIEVFIPEAVFQIIINEIPAVGGLLIIAIGLNLLKITNIRITNLLPALPLAALFIYLTQLFYI